VFAVSVRGPARQNRPGHAAQLAAQTSPSEWSIEGVSATQHDRAHAKEVVELF